MTDVRRGRDYELDDLKPRRRYFPGDESYEFKEIEILPDKALMVYLSYPVRVGDVVRILDTMGHARAIQGHVTDVTENFAQVSSVLGRRSLFFTATGYKVGSYQWQLEPYAKVPFDG